MADEARAGRSGGVTPQPDRPRPESSSTGSLVFAGALLALGVLLLVESRRISGFMALAMGPEVYPRAVTVVLIVTALICVVVEVRSRRSVTAEAHGEPRRAQAGGALAAPLLIAGMLVVYVWALGALGFYVSSFAFTAALIVVIGRFSGTEAGMRRLVVRAVVMALLITGAIYGAVQLIAMRVPTTGLFF